MLLSEATVRAEREAEDRIDWDESRIPRPSKVSAAALFGHDLADYDELFDEKLDLLLPINASERVTWPGHHRRPCVTPTSHIRVGGAVGALTCFAARTRDRLTHHYFDIDFTVLWA